MHRGLVQHPVLQLQVRAGERIGGALADLVNRAGRERHAEQITRELEIPRREIRCRAVKVTTAACNLGPNADPPIPPASWRLVRAQAPRATQPMRAMLGPDHADRRQLSDLTATEPPPGPPLVRGELATTPAARLRIVVDDLIDLIGGTQLATRTPMPGLTASLTLLALPAHQLLGFRSCLRTPLRPGLRRIGRRRLGTRARVLTRRSLQTTQPLLQLPHPGSEIENELDTYLSAGVIDRLRLRALHTCKIRCTKQESLPNSPTTERLHK